MKKMIWLFLFGTFFSGCHKHPFEENGIPQYKNHKGPAIVRLHGYNGAAPNNKLIIFVSGASTSITKATHQGAKVSKGFGNFDVLCLCNDSTGENPVNSYEKPTATVTAIQYFIEEWLERHTNGSIAIVAYKEGTAQTALALNRLDPKYEKQIWPLMLAPIQPITNRNLVHTKRLISKRDM